MSVGFRKFGTLDPLVFSTMSWIRPSEVRPRPLRSARSRETARDADRGPAGSRLAGQDLPDRHVTTVKPELIGLTEREWGGKLSDLRIIGGTPPAVALSEVIAVPQYRALFTLRGELIEESLRTRRGRRQLSGFSAPDRISVPRRIDHVGEPRLYGGTLHRHFGHFLLEGTSRLWPLLHAQIPLLVDPERHPGAAAHRDTVLAGLLGRESPPRFVTRPTMFHSVTIPTPSYEYGGSAWAIHRDIPSLIAEMVAGESTSATTDQPLYLSRERLSGGRRRASDESVLTARLRDKGFKVVCPETLSFVSQVRLVQRHRVIVGLLGSALHLVLFGPFANGMTVHLVDRETTVRSDYPVMDALTYRRSAYIACTGRETRDSRRGNDAALTLDVEAAVSGLRTLGLLG